MHRAARGLSIGGSIIAVLALSKIHAAYVAADPYDFTASPRLAWATLYIVILCVATYALGLPDQARSVRDAALRGMTAALASAFGISIFQLALGDALLPRFVVFSTVPLSALVQVLAHLVTRRGSTRRAERDRVLVVGAPAECRRLEADVLLRPERPASVVGSLTPQEARSSCDGGALITRSKELGATLIVLDHTAQADGEVLAQVAQLHSEGRRVRTLQAFYEQWLGKLPLADLEQSVMLFDIGELHSTGYERAKRLLDVVISSLGCLALAAVIPVVVVGNIVGNRGPLFYRQVRVGRNGVPFTILKFRSMSPGDGPQDWTELEDPRVTSFGGVLRRTHVDELPQMLNILRGDLTMVGPRPEQPRYVAELRSQLNFYDMRHLVRPGLTGWAQVKYGYAGSEEDALEKLQYEFFYLSNQDLRFDARIMVRTVRSLAGGSGHGR